MYKGIVIANRLVSRQRAAAKPQAPLDCLVLPQLTCQCQDIYKCFKYACFCHDMNVPELCQKQKGIYYENK